MREELLHPVSDKKRLASAVKLAEELYRLHEAGKDYSEPLERFATLVGQKVTKFDVDAAFGTCDADAFAEDLLADRKLIPQDLTYEEMLELVRRICSVEGTDFQNTYWVNCLQVNTGDDRISDLIFWPDEYFGDGNVRREMTPQEILNTALAAGKKRLA